MSRLAGLARSSDKKGSFSGLAPASPSQSPSPPDAESNTFPSRPSLSALASETRPRQSLSGLAAGTAGATGTGGSKTSLSGLGARAETNINGGSSLQDLARGATNATAVGRGLGAMTGGRPSLSSLAQSSPISASVTAAVSGPSSPSASNTLSLPGSSTPSLTQLAAVNQTTTPPRRSLVGLATASTARPALSTPSFASSTPTALGSSMARGLTPRSGGGASLSSLAGLGEQGRRSSLTSKISISDSTPTEIPSTITGASSPSLSSLSSASSQQKRSPPSLTSLSKPSSAPAVSTQEALYTQHPTSEAAVSAADLESQPTSSEASATTDTINRADTLDRYTLQNDSSSFTDPSEMIGSSPFSSLIAAPSHFALSIFERLDPAPSLIALTTTASLQSSDPEALLRNAMTPRGIFLKGARVEVEALGGGGGMGAITPARVFKFDTPSPDDAVFKAQAQGYRPVGMPSRV